MELVQMDKINRKIKTLQETWHRAFADASFEQYPVLVGGMEMVVLYGQFSAQKLDVVPPEVCPFETLNSENLIHEYDDILTDYALLPNRYPFMPYHFVLPHRKHISMQENNQLKSDLEQMMAFSKATDMVVFHNSPGAGASIPQHEHWQALGTKPPLLSLAVSWQDGIGWLPDYPGANVVANDTHQALAVTNDPLFKEHNTILYHDTIILVPRKAARSQYLQRRVAGAEIMGFIPWKKHEDALKMKERPEELLKGFKEVLYRRDAV
ncbi:hypothetical protein HY639_01675 [Candidatus Woesearchaeota archaeon]|nr:hypothetical protein [Candidatus Woesearchaeota archaeon]